MARYIVTGRVHPERADINFTKVEWPLDNGRVIAQCDASQVTVLIDLTDVNDVVSAYIMAEHFALMVVGALGFSLGSGYSVELINVIDEQGAPFVFGVRPKLAETNETLEFKPHGEIFNRALRLAARNIFFRLALRDYLRAIPDAIDCATHCYRAIEGIKSAFTFATGKDRWDDMHAVLATDRHAIESTIKQFADPVRHGNWIAAPNSNARQRWDMLVLTRDILLKYLDQEFPADQLPST